jgi:hypothetical protein
MEVQTHRSVHALHIKHRAEPSALVYRTLALERALNVEEVQKGR